MNDFDLSVFVEFGVGLAGFSGVVVAFSRRGGQLGDYDRFRVVQLLCSSLIPAFLGLLPIILLGLGLQSDAIWRVMGAALMLCIAANYGVAIVTARRVTPEARASLSPGIWWVALGGSTVFLVWNGLNLAGWPRPPSPGPILAGMAFFLVMASLMFFRLLLVRFSGGEDGD